MLFNEFTNSTMQMYCAKHKNMSRTLWTTALPLASFCFGVGIWLVKVVGQFSINYFRGLGLRIRVRVMVRVRLGLGLGLVW